MNLHRIQKRTLEILDEAGLDDSASRLCDIVLAVLVIANIAAVMLESVPSLEARWAPWFTAFELVSVIVFSVEYLLRLWASGAPHGHPPRTNWRGRRGYALSFYGIVDLLAILPFYLQFLFPGADLRVLRVLRLVRVFKLSHYSSAIEDLFQAIREERRSFVAAMYLLLIALLLTSSLMYFAENEAQPDKFASIPDAMYWSIITLTTVGYGDVTPVTWAGRAISSVTAFLGVCTLALLTGIVATSFANQMYRRKAMFQAEVQAALADGRMTHGEREKLEEMRKAFNLSAQQAEQMIREVNAKPPAPAIARRGPDQDRDHDPQGDSTP